MLSYKHNKPRKVCEIETLQVLYAIHDIPSLYTRWKELESTGWQFFVVDQLRGYCSRDRKYTTIPKWCLAQDKGMWVYYVAHEFAHTPVSTTEKIKGKWEDHGPKFMKELIRLCPKEYLHHELEYKEKQATSAGITQEYKDQAKNVKLVKLLDCL